MNDSWIAATYIAAGIPLATFNTEDHEDFAQHDKSVNPEERKIKAECVRRSWRHKTPGHSDEKWRRGDLNP